MEACLRQVVKHVMSYARYNYNGWLDPPGVFLLYVISFKIANK